MGRPVGVAANVGTILHWAMETVPEPEVDALEVAVEERRGELLFEAPWLAERQRRIARRLTEALAEYSRTSPDWVSGVVGAEKRFEFEVDNAVVRGSIDRVELSGEGEVVIVDLKTGTPITSQSRTDEHSQLLAYQLAYAEGVLNEALAEHGEHTGGGAKLLFIKEGGRREALPGGGAGTARSRAARAVPRAHPRGFEAHRRGELRRGDRAAAVRVQQPLATAVGASTGGVQ